MKRSTRRIGADRFEDSYNSKDKGIGGNKDILNYRELGDKAYSFFNPKEGKNKINIIPYEIKTKNHPLVATKRKKIGDLDYMLDIWVHRNIGPTGVDAVCLKRNYNKACPICEEAYKLRDQAKKAEYDALKASRRVFYNVQDLSDDSEALKIFNVSHFLFEKELIEVAKDDSDGGETVYFAEIDEGKIIEFRGTKEPINGREMLKFKNFIFRERPEALSEDIIDTAISFDELIISRDAKELSKLLFEEPDEETPGDDSKEDSEPEEVEEKGDKKGTTVKSAKGGQDCPHGFVFGKDCDTQKACIRCAVYDACAKAQSEEG